MSVSLPFYIIASFYSILSISPCLVKFFLKSRFSGLWKTWKIQVIELKVRENLEKSGNFRKGVA